MRQVIETRKGSSSIASDPDFSEAVQVAESLGIVSLVLSDWSLVFPNTTEPGFSDLGETPTHAQVIKLILDRLDPDIPTAAAVGFGTSSNDNDLQLFNLMVYTSENEALEVLEELYQNNARVVANDPSLAGRKEYGVTNRTVWSVTSP